MDDDEEEEEEEEEEDNEKEEEEEGKELEEEKEKQKRRRKTAVSFKFCVRKESYLGYEKTRSLGEGAGISGPLRRKKPHAVLARNLFSLRFAFAAGNPGVVGFDVRRRGQGGKYFLISCGLSSWTELKVFGREFLTLAD
ncbi:hypothetical protein M8J77_009730 [Diaphorina citri]|nr:hypothetical protein M8J77_009730 [Diaphorina citri]